ncbi:MAG: hypothetical protein HC923_13035, partial [Myxococcales bacterium]|nr:hypothetical protein [Myxococcales bacterium]
MLGQPDDAAEGQVLRHGVVHLGHMLEAGPALACQHVVHMHDDLVVLGMDRADAALALQHFGVDVLSLHAV